MASRLRNHLLREHGRAGWELHGLPLADLHRLEHLEQEMGLIGLTHRHVVGGEEPHEASAGRGGPVQ
jgi:hypothetical protein